MYDYYVILKGENKNFATFEFENLWNLYTNEKIILKHIENIYFQFSSNFLISKHDIFLKRLTLTNFIGINLFSSNSFEDIKKLIQDSLNLDNLQDKTFSVRTKILLNNLNKKDLPFKINELAKPIFNKFETPRVNLENPDLEFYYLFLENNSKIIFGEKIYENNKNYLKRMPKLRPVKMPYTLKSDMARAAINCLNIKEGLLLDPFCGIGGILLEGYDMDFNILGNDISWNDLKYLQKNFDYYFPNNKQENRISITLSDSSKQIFKENSIDAVVTDIPYGKCCRRLGDDLYENFLKNAKSYLKPNKRIVIIYANFTNFKPIALKYFKEVIEIDEYINKSMTRYILVLENNK